MFPIAGNSSTGLGLRMHVERISDLSDPRLADFRDLTDAALRLRSEAAGGLYIAESPKVIATAIAAGHVPRAVLLLEQWLSDLEPLVTEFDVPVFVGDSALLESLTGFRMHRGAIASMHRPPLPSVADVLHDARRVVVLENIVDHTNVGAIFRAVAGLGADAVLITPRCADPLYRRSVRVSMGTVLQLPWTRLESWPDGAAQLTSAGFHIAALALADHAVTLDVFAADPPERIALVLGTEGDGLSQSALAIADTVVTIPMLRGIDSLNVASASAVALWALRVPRAASTA
jgi:tRNA G18 (ribose-2'-O)-methylase SpoU